MESGDVYGVGENWYGQLGIGSKDRQTEVFWTEKRKFFGAKVLVDLGCFLSRWHVSR